MNKRYITTEMIARMTVGSQIEITYQEVKEVDDRVYRAGVKSVEVNINGILVQFEWCAQKVGSHWVVDNNWTCYGASNLLAPNNSHDGCISLQSMSYRPGELARLYPPGHDSNIRPEDVIGLMLPAHLQS